MKIIVNKKILNINKQNLTKFFINLKDNKSRLNSRSLISNI